MDRIDARSRTLARLGAVASVVSAALVGEWIQSTYDWDPFALTLVSAWGATVSVSLAASVVAPDLSEISHRLAQSALALGVMSLLAFVVAGIAYAAQAHPGCACVGG